MTKPEKSSRIGFQQWADPSILASSSNKQEVGKNSKRIQRQPLHQASDSGSHSTSDFSNTLPSDQLGEQHGQNHQHTGNNRQPSTTILLSSSSRASSRRRNHASERLDDESGLNKDRRELTGIGMKIQSIFRHPSRKSLMAVSLLSLFLIGYTLGASTFMTTISGPGPKGTITIAQTITITDFSMDWQTNIASLSLANSGTVAVTGTATVTFEIGATSIGSLSQSYTVPASGTQKVNFNMGNIDLSATSQILVAT